MSLDGNSEGSTTSNSTAAVKEVPKDVRDSETNIIKVRIGDDVRYLVVYGS